MANVRFPHNRKITERFKLNDVFQFNQFVKSLQASQENLQDTEELCISVTLIDFIAIKKRQEDK